MELPSSVQQDRNDVIQFVAQVIRQSTIMRNDRAQQERAKDSVNADQFSGQSRTKHGNEQQWNCLIEDGARIGPANQPGRHRPHCKDHGGDE
jgi:hypothetical protein